MRPIKFRGIRKDNGEWVHGYLVSGGLFGGPESECWIFSDKHFIEVLPESVGQWTGILDRNKNEVYGGDRVEIETGDNNYQYGTVQWNNKYLCWETGHDSHCSVNRFYLFPFRVIGTIHTHPELLEKKSV